MSLRKLFKASGHPTAETKPGAELKRRLGELLMEPGAAERLNALGLPTGSFTNWRIRDLAIAVHRLENISEHERADLPVSLEYTVSETLTGEVEEIHRHVVDEEQELQKLIRLIPTPYGIAPTDRPEWFWEIGVAVNAAFKGLLGSQGQSGHICARAIPVTVQLHTEDGWAAVLSSVVDALAGSISNGDTVVLADKVVAAAQGRIGSREILLDPDPKTIPPQELSALAVRRQKELGFVITPLHLLLADEFGNEQATLGAEDHNSTCAELAAEIYRRLGKAVDVVISDTDTGLDVRQPLIGTLTIGATPLGATAGLTLYEAMRCAVAAEFMRGHTRGIPVVICVPAERRRHRPKIGVARGYVGALNAANELGITHA